MENVFRDPSFKKNLPAALLHLRPGGLRVIRIIKSAPTGYHGDALRPLPISAGYVAANSIFVCRFCENFAKKGGGQT